MLLELSVVEQRYQAVLAVIRDGVKVVDVAHRFDVSRQAVHRWLGWYEDQGAFRAWWTGPTVPPGARIRWTRRWRCGCWRPAGAIPTGDPGGWCTRYPGRGWAPCRRAQGCTGPCAGRG
jgi:hypothetical protein